jgi:hypothetical protein
MCETQRGPVSRRMNSLKAANDDPTLIAPAVV